MAGKKFTPETGTLHNMTQVMPSKPRHVPHCRVLPPGKFNGMMSQQLPIYSGSSTNNHFGVQLQQ